MQEIMPIDNIPDWEKRIERTDAFWDREIIDRPMASMVFRKNDSRHPRPKPKSYPSLSEQWMDSEYLAECALADVMNTEYAGDALPLAWPNLGPDVFAALLGCELEFGETTSWSSPILDEWGEAEHIGFSEENSYHEKLIEMTDALLETGKGRFYSGLTDMHPGGDAIAALRGPQMLNIDMAENRGRVKSLREMVDRIYMRVFDFYHGKLTAARQPATTWCSIVSSRKWSVVSNDFSCMISKEMFDDVFLPGIVEECRFLDASLYHLDGPGALRHLDSLLDIADLDAVQWVPGEGNGRASDWMHVYKKMQAAGKGMQISLALNEIDFFVENLRPEGLWLGIYGVEDVATAESVLRKISTWR